VSLTPSAVGQWRALYKGKSVGVTRAIPFATTFIDLNCKMEMWVRGPFDYLHFTFLRGCWRIALDNGISPSFRLQEASFIEDLVVAQMTKGILNPVDHGEPLDRLALDQIAMVLGAHTCKRTAARQSSHSDRGAGWKRGKSSEPRRCCERIWREYQRQGSRRRLLPFGKSFRAVLPDKFWHVRPSAPHSTSDRARQRAAFTNHQVSCGSCLAIRLLRSGCFDADLQAAWNT